MSKENNITFENDTFKYKSRVVLGQPEVPKMVKFLLNKGIVKNEKTAQNILIGVTVICFGISFYFINSIFFNPPTVDYTNLIKTKN